MELQKCFVFVLLIFEATFVYGSKKQCTLSLNSDFGSPSPVFFQDGGFLSPDARSGDVSLSQSDSVAVACPGDKAQLSLGNVTQGVNVQVAQCVSNRTFRVDGWVGPFKEIACSRQPQYAAEETTEKCAGDHKMYRVGYRLRTKFHILYKACFDKYLKSTLYVKHQLAPSSKFLQIGPRPQFTEGDVFGKTHMSQLYRESNQRARVNAALGEGMDEVYITKKQSLTRGHLAPRADFPLRATQRVTFHYVNTAPQWRRGNSGDWAALEDSLRRRIHAYNSSVLVYTGSHGVVTLDSRDGTPGELYLGTDENNNGIVPVPLYFYKVVYDPRRKTAVAFVSINSSYYSKTAIERLSFCDDICDDNANYAWLKWRNDGTHSFCCEYEQFAGRINSLPRLDVKGLFY